MNMKIYIAVALLFLVSCKEKSNNLVVSGTIQNNPGRQIVFLDLVEFDAVNPKTLDTAVLEAGSANFSLRAIPEENESMYRLRFEKDGAFILLTNDVNDIKVNANWTDLNSYTTNSTSSNSIHNLLKTFNARLAVIDSLREQYISAKNDNAGDSTITAADSTFRVYVKAAEDYLLNYADTTKSPIVAMYIVGPLLKTQVDAARFEPVMTNMAKRFRDDDKVQKVVKEYFDFMQQKQASDIIGKEAPDFSIPDVNGKQVSLSSFRGKYVLVDFGQAGVAPAGWKTRMS
jgi:hypothetical protein